MNRIPVAILGGSGFGGGELLRLLAGHPGVRVTQVISRQHSGKPVPAAHPHLLGMCDLGFTPELDLDALLGGDRSILFSALPNGKSGAALERILARANAAVPSSGGGAGADDRSWPEGLTAIDLSGDLRLSDSAEHGRAYPETPEFPGLRAMARYGLPELGRDGLRGAVLISNPGCFATALQLALAPLVAAGLRGFVSADGATGSSGGGSVPSETAHHPNRHSGYRAYKLDSHAHVPEVRQQFGEGCPRLSFVPHSAPMVRGIFVTLHAPRESFTGEMPGPEEVRAHYAGEPFIRLRGASPSVLDVAGTNFCDLHLSRTPDRVVMCAALDNLGKGMAGQAVQNMNLSLGLKEDTGLWHAAPRPI